jgi:hypothetical protein
MARDLFLGRTRRNWARGACSRSLTPISDEVTFRLTELEIAMLAELAATRARASSGDRSAKKKIAGLAKKLASLERRAARGDAAARRTLLVLRESGALQPVQVLTMGGEQVSNTDYRVAVLRQARRLAGGRPPRTLDFARAKSAVDGAMRAANISLFLPGSRQGRVTH